MAKIILDWSKYKEEELHTLICMLFGSLNYHVKNLHEADRANEDGADIIVTKGEERIAIAVKIKPDNKDRPQLIELSDREEERKIYIYTKTPTDKFQKFIKSFSNKIEFWDSKKLNDFFRKENPYFMANLIYENSELYTTLDEIKLLFFTLREKCSKISIKPFPKLDKQSFFLLWRLKDVSVTMHQTNNMLTTFVKNPMEFNSGKFDDYFFNIFSDYLNRLDQKVFSFLKYFILFYSKNMDLVNNSIITQMSRSHWFWLASFKPSNDLVYLKDSLKRMINEKKLLDELESQNLELLNNNEHLLEISKSNNIWQAIEKQVISLRTFGDAMECIIDDIISEYFNDYDFMNNLGNQIEGRFST